MQPEFWYKKWDSNQIGFHQAEANPYLQRYWTELAIAPSARVLVPLCGKSLDLLWLAGQGHQVIGVELAEKAVEEFFSEHQLQPQISEKGAFKVYRSDAIELWCGDFFALTAGDVVGCTALYDRAALIALPDVMRQRYAAHLQHLLAPEVKGLVITLDYDQTQIPGPPFAVTDDEVQRLLGEGWQVDELEQQDVLAESPKFLQAGAEWLVERVYRVSSR
ncbi:thiopurine S-methyltransferase [Pseudomonas mercuritolerans]|jgi:thiopurine S-methyltransferase|uniref:Thiopurine S-methyltransferase n=1 Tax=Pseudomonas mercuritolerans TaxID=2951809 RepID=A0ABT2XVP5_9PSED|nr:thiopurine S-methyltransferase [Pseudomonas mercuritolerans]MCV2222767.1 thiopurine S-methyltransferase [Pseudomonas mercuritolerans]